MTFGSYDIVAIIQLKDNDNFGKIQMGSIQPIPGAEESLTYLAVEN